MGGGPAFKKVSRKNRHTDIYKVAIQNKDYEILLVDDSIFQFSIENYTLRYAFIQNPRLFINKEDFLTYLYTAEYLLSFTEDELVELQNSINEEDYEQYLNEQDLNLEAQIIRYDLDLNGYDPLIHSCSHIHIGLNTNLRIPCSKILTPLNFIFFSVKHTYYKEWKAGIYEESMQIQLKDSKRASLELPKSQWIEKETYEFYLH